MALLAGLGVPTGGLQVVQGGPAYMHPGRSGTLQLGPKTVVGHFGELHPAVLDAFDGSAPASCFEIILDALPPPKSKSGKARGRLERADLMPVERDFAFVADRMLPAADILRAVQAAERNLIADLTVFDVYEGAGVPEGKKSVAVAVRLQPRERTLTETDLDEVSRKIVAEVERKTGAVLRI
jgi:phenylalanyl-tRNA synthetase beta chain